MQYCRALFKNVISSQALILYKNDIQLENEINEQIGVNPL